jgi:hypothetical protein
MDYMFSPIQFDGKRVILILSKEKINSQTEKGARTL